MLLTYSRLNLTSFQKKITLHDEVVLLYKSSVILSIISKILDQYITFCNA